MLYKLVCKGSWFLCTVYINFYDYCTRVKIVEVVLNDDENEPRPRIILSEIRVIHVIS